MGQATQPITSERGPADLPPVNHSCATSPHLPFATGHLPLPIIVHMNDTLRPNACYQCLSSSAIKPAGTQCFLVASAGTHPSFRRQVVQPEPLKLVQPWHFEHPRSPSDIRHCEKVTLFLPKRLSPIGGSSSVVPQGVSRAGRSRSGFGYGSGNTRKHACTL